MKLKLCSTIKTILAFTAFTAYYGIVYAQYSFIAFKDSVVVTKENSHVFTPSQLDSNTKVSIKNALDSNMIISDSSTINYEHFNSSLNLFFQNRLKRISQNFAVADSITKDLIQLGAEDVDKYRFQIISIIKNYNAYYIVNVIHVDKYPNWENIFYTTFDGGHFYTRFYLW